ncbi:hypothetical protein [Microbacterium binotii]|uniref:hypothetical protein n=1 Tax=Microbacterium binotii TaxID=462710 RepID=UPI001F37510B|nr:hypothetical protein [Microbacterium binotii]UIN31336.1 hypothetical protein LXM64_03780 [Microbacterium binotii]
MTARDSSVHRAVGAVALAVAFAGSTVACAAVAPASGDASTPSASTQEFQAVYDAVAASDPRVERASTVSTSLSGVTTQLTVVVRVSGDEPISTQTLTAVLVAIRDSAPGDANMLDLVARDAQNPKEILDLSDAISALPSGMSLVWIDGGLVVPIEDLRLLA